MRHTTIALLLALFVFNQSVLAETQQTPPDPETAAAQEMTPEQAQYLLSAKKIWDSLNRQQGDIKLLDGIVSLHVPD